MSDEAWDARMDSYIEEAEKQIAGLNAEITRLRAEVEALARFAREIDSASRGTYGQVLKARLFVKKLLVKHGLMNEDGRPSDLLAARGGEG